MDLTDLRAELAGHVDLSGGEVRGHDHHGRGCKRCTRLRALLVLQADHPINESVTCPLCGARDTEPSGIENHPWTCLRCGTIFVGSQGEYDAMRHSRELYQESHHAKPE